MNMEFLILQGNTQSINGIDYKLACYQRERREVQADITTVTEQMQDFEDAADYVVTSNKENAKNEYDLAIKNFQTEATAAYNDQTKAKSLWTTASADATKLKNELDSLPKDSPLREKAQERYDKAKKIADEAELKYKEASDIYSDKVKESQTNQQNAYTTYQTNLQNIDGMRKLMKSQYEADMKANLKSLNNRDSRLELSINELNTMKEMYKSEKENAQSAIEEEADKLAPKY